MKIYEAWEALKKWAEEGDHVIVMDKMEELKMEYE